MKKRLFFAGLLIFLGLILLAFFINLSPKITGKTAEESYRSFTKAICNESHCQDYEFMCKGENIISQTPITGAVIQISDDWIDPRNESEQKELC